MSSLPSLPDPSRSACASASWAPASADSAWRSSSTSTASATSSCSRRAPRSAAPGGTTPTPALPATCRPSPTRSVGAPDARHRRDRLLRRQDRPLRPLNHDYYPALARDNVDLVAERIAQITPRGVMTDDGVEREVDAVVVAPGFYMSQIAYVLDALRTMRAQGIAAVEPRPEAQRRWNDHRRRLARFDADRYLTTTRPVSHAAPVEMEHSA